MPLFAFYAKDKPEGASLRETHRTAHRANMTRLDQDGRLIFAGPLKDDEGTRSIGSLIIFVAENVAVARGLMEADPYVRAGVFEWFEVLPTLKAYPKAM